MNKYRSITSNNDVMNRAISEASSGVDKGNYCGERGIYRIRHCRGASVKSRVKSKGGDPEEYAAEHMGEWKGKVANDAFCSGEEDSSKGLP